MPSSGLIGLIGLLGLFHSSDTFNFYCKKEIYIRELRDSFTVHQRYTKMVEEGEIVEALIHKTSTPTAS